MGCGASSAASTVPHNPPQPAVKELTHQPQETKAEKKETAPPNTKAEQRTEPAIEKNEASAEQQPIISSTKDSKPNTQPDEPEKQPKTVEVSLSPIDQVDEAEGIPASTVQTIAGKKQRSLR